MANYQLWNLDRGNCIGAFDNEAAALAEVRAGVAEDGPVAWEATALLRAGERDEAIEPIAEGAELVSLALADGESALVTGAASSVPGEVLVRIEGDARPMHILPVAGVVTITVKAGSGITIEKGEIIDAPSDPPRRAAGD